ncbi:unnamed protein product [Echinostoma caproni]|uniref:Glutamate receptor ionotropic, kainate 3 n=1 Tax=Echinostoma caproni TaxID=27848 RepID=A0A183A7A6_9TREM|nr:unnamed protein product [Echinostoma caproni]
MARCTNASDVTDVPITNNNNNSAFQVDDLVCKTRVARNVKSVIYIGVLLMQGDEALEAAFRTGIQAANQVLRENEALQFHQLEPLIETVPKENVFAATQQACRLLDRGIVALYGPRNAALSKSLLSLANRFGVPYVETQWNLSPTSDTYSLSMYPKADTFGEGLYEYLTRVEKWRHVTIIHEHPESLLKYVTLINKFEDGLKVKSWAANSAATRAMLAELSTGNERNFLVDIPTWQVRDFLVMDVNFMDLSAFKVTMGAQIKTFSILSKIGMTESLQRSLLSSWQTDAPGSSRTTGQPMNRPILGLGPEMNTHFGLLYDSILLLAHGLVTVTKTRSLLPQKLSCERPPGLWPLGLSLINAMKSTRPELVRGYTGQFRFDREGLRTLFDITTLDLTEGGFVPTGIWNVDEQMKIVTRPPKKLPHKLAKDTPTVLKVTTKQDPPFMIIKKKDAYGKPLITPDAWQGYCIDLLDEISKKVGFNYTVHLTPDGNYGSSTILPNGTEIYDGIMGELIRREVDMAVAAFTITYEREKLVDFSTPWMTIGGSIMFTRPKSQKPSLFSFLQPLAPQVWFYVLAIYFAVCVCMFIASRLSPYEWNAPHACEDGGDMTKNQFTLLNSFYYNISALLNQGTELAPQATSTRLLTGVWWFFALIIIATYTANLAAFLTVENTKSPIESAEDLANQDKIKYGTISSGSSRDFFKTTTLSTFKKMGDFMDKHPEYLADRTEIGVERVKQGNYAFILESAWNEYYVQRDCSLMQVGALLDSKGYGIGFPQGSPWRDRVSSAILQLQNDQQLDKLKRKWWNEYNITEPCNLLRESSKAPSPLGVEQIGGVFIMLLVGFFLGFMVSIVEFIIATRDKKRSDILKAMWRELTFAVRCLTTSKRLKSEVKKMPRSRSNIKLISSVQSGMCAMDPKLAYIPPTIDPHVTGESADPLLANAQTHPAQSTMNTTQPDMPSSLGSLDFEAGPAGDYPVPGTGPGQINYPWTSGPAAAAIQRRPNVGRVKAMKTSMVHPENPNATGGQELWQFNQAR